MALLTRNTCRTLQCLLRKRNMISQTKVRTILSNAYYCKEPWQQRLHTPTLQKVDAEDFALRLQEKFDREGIIAPVDIDILANKIEFIPRIQIDFVQALFHRFRHTKSAVHMPESTPHALIRALLQLKEYDRLREILKDKIHYGIFLDNFTANILMDHFIEENMHLEAAEVAFDLMWQEDFSHPISHALAWYACHLLWKNPAAAVEEVTEVAEDVEAAEEDEDEDEEKLIPVPFLLNYFYDDHFDMPKINQRLGKTLVMVSANQANLLGRSYQLIGWGLYEKFEKGAELLKTWAESEEKEAVCLEALEDFESRLKSVETREPSPAKDPGEMSLEDEYPYITEQEKQDILERHEKYSAILKSSGKVVDNFDMEGEILKTVNNVVSKLENHDIKACTDTYTAWNSQRETLVEQQIQQYKDEQLKAELESRLLSLKEREEKLTYFEHENSIRLKARLGRKIQEVDDIFDSEEMQNWAPRT